MMYENLEKYISEIRSYLTAENKEDILMEIKEHIIEKTEKKYGTLNEDNIEKIISEYGSPVKVAETYSEDEYFIAPYYKNHVFLLTNLLFTLQIGIALIGSIFKIDFVNMKADSIAIFENIFQSLFYNYIFSFGLICLIFYFITKKGIKSINIKFIDDFSNNFKEEKLTYTRLLSKFITLIIVSVILIYLPDKIADVYKNGDITVMIPKDRNFFMSLIGIFVIDFTAYLVKFITKNNLSDIINIVKDISVIGLLWYVISNMHTMFNNIPAIDAREGIIIGIKTGMTVLIVLTVFITFTELIALSIKKSKKRFNM